MSAGDGGKAKPNRLIWIVPTILVVVAVAVMIRLGLWQLDRLEQRRRLNTQLVQGMSQPALDFAAGIPPDLAAMAYRQAVVTGEYVHEEDMLLRNQVWEGEAGYHLLTPLHIAGGNSLILVDRGFIPLAEGNPQGIAEYREEGTVTVRGELRPSVAEPRFSGTPDKPLADGEGWRLAWNFTNLELISAQTSQPLVNAWLAAAPEESNPQVKTRRMAPEAPDLSEGSHFGYAIQWFTFAAILLIGYPFYVRQHLYPKKRK